MEKTYQANRIEAHWHVAWEEQGCFTPSGHGAPYCIMIPPPNVTGSLHMGHGFECTLIDCMIRYQRSMGRNTLWQVGTDHAGIATQMVVERQLLAQNKSRQAMGRDAFVSAVWDWKAESGGLITQQLRRMGASVDWSREKFTMDPSLSKAVTETFVRLYQDGLIYRGERLVNWDPKLETAISDLEVVNRETKGSLWHMRYPITDQPGEYVVVATTRPETLFGDSAVAVHPDDERYQHLIGKTVTLPLAERDIPIIADDEVDMAFGSGCVKITPAHDFNDYQMGLRHALPQIKIMTKTAHLNDLVPVDFQGLTREQAREQVIEHLTAQDLLEKTEPHTLQLPIGDRSGVVIEPYLTKQWFVKCQPLAEPALAAVRSGEIQFYPKNHENTYFHWLETIQDWCISRQLWWGHQIPAWYDAEGNVYVGADEASVRKKHQLDASVTLTQDMDVLDTWFSSALWPFATLGWPEKTPDLDTFFPTQTLITGHDLIFYWVARMIMMSLYCTGQIPFAKVCIHGLIRDEHNDKMSKSKGNVIDPLDLIDGIALDDLIAKRTHGMMQPARKNTVIQNTKKAFPNGIEAHGTDALRFTFCALATTGRDVRFDMQRLDGYRNFCNKLWNASRFVLQLVDKTPAPVELKDISICDQWILHRLEAVKTKVHAYYDHFRFDHLAQLLYDFVWTDFCSWYIELAKAQIAEHPDAIPATHHTLLTVLKEVLVLLHPIIPYITESIWQEIAKHHPVSHNTISLTPFPAARDGADAFAAHAQMTWMMQTVTAIRTMRSEMQISPAKTIAVTLASSDASDHEAFQQQCKLVAALAKADLQWIAHAAESADLPPSAQQLIAKMTVAIPLKGLIKKNEEVDRVEKQISKLQKLAERGDKQLSNPRYVENAPEALVAEVRQQVAQWREDIQRYEKHMAVLSTLDDDLDS